MDDGQHNSGNSAALLRMIAYVRNEAVRLHIMDVALLLEHAEHALLNFAPQALATPAVELTHDGSVLDH